MLTTCIYVGRTPLELSMCHKCSEFMESCVPIVSADGFSNGECGCYFCECCPWECLYAQQINL